MYLGIGLGITRLSGVLGPAPFSPLDLFASGEEGAWYDPSDLTTLYQDAAGTTPVTGTGQPVGLMLDKSKGLTLGPEAVTNGTFDTDISGWSTHGGGAALSWNAGRLLCSTTSSFNGAKQAITTVAGKTYLASITVYPNGSSELRIGVGDGANLSDIQLFIESPSVTKTYSFYFKALSSTTTVSVTAGNLPVTGSFEVDNVTVKELPGNHATQSTSTARPTLQLSGSSYYLDFDGVDDYMEMTLASAQPQPVSLACSWKQDAIGTFNFIYDGVSDSYTRHVLRSTNAGPVYQIGGPTITTTSFTADTSEHVSVYLAPNGSDYTFKLNGQTETGTGIGANSWGALTLGSWYQQTQYWLDGRIYGFIGINRSLDPDEITSVESYLADKTGAFTAPVITGVPTISVS